MVLTGSHAVDYKRLSGDLQAYFKWYPPIPKSYDEK